MDQNLKKHIGKTNTGQRCIVVYLEIPGKKDHCLILPVDGLPPRLEQAVMSILEGNAGQAAVNLADELNKHTLPETGQNVLTTLHSRMLLQAVPHSLVTMFPRPNMPFPLADIIANMKLMETGDLTQNTPPMQKFNPHEVGLAADVVDKNNGIARNLIIEAEDLEAVARKKRENAYALVPSLRPAPPAPVKAAKTKVAEVTETVEKPKAKRAKKAAAV